MAPVVNSILYFVQTPGTNHFDGFLKTFPINIFFFAVNDIPPVIGIPSLAAGALPMVMVDAALSVLVNPVRPLVPSLGNHQDFTVEPIMVAGQELPDHSLFPRPHFITNQIPAGLRLQLPLGSGDHPQVHVRKKNLRFPGRMPFLRQQVF